MPGPAFTAYAAQAAAAVDAVMAEDWWLLPRKAAANVNAPQAADPDRWSGPLRGTFTDPAARPEMPNGYDLRQTRRAGTEGGHPHCLVSPAAVLAMRALAAPLGLAATIRQGDQLRRDADGVLWRVTGVFPTAGGALRLSLAILG